MAAQATMSKQKFGSVSRYGALVLHSWQKEYLFKIMILIQFVDVEY
jgi:hypothetical protein